MHLWSRSRAHIKHEVQNVKDVILLTRIECSNHSCMDDDGVGKTSFNSGVQLLISSARVSNDQAQLEIHRREYVERSRRPTD
jgi:hypothetical protein